MTGEFDWAPLYPLFRLQIVYIKLESHTQKTTLPVSSLTMASATGVPERFPPIEDLPARETEPLLGRPGDAAQEDGVPLIKNLVLGKLRICT